jgi:hypothetical protein
MYIYAYTGSGLWSKERTAATDRASDESESESERSSDREVASDLGEEREKGGG